MRAQGGVPVPLEAAQTYAAKYAQRDPFVLPLLKSGQTGVIDCAELVPRETLVNTDVYRYVHAPGGYSYPGLVAMTCTLRRFEVISFWRTEEEGYLDEDSVHLLELLVPHLQSAMEIRQALGIADVQLAGMRTMTDASPTATFLLGADGDILHANAAAHEILREADGFIEDRGRLEAAKPGMRKALRALIRGSSTSGTSMGAFPLSRSLALERTSERRPFQLLASPVPNYGPTIEGLEADSGILMLATDPEKPVVLRDEVLRTHYRFTEAETEIANGLLTGFSVAEIAALRRVTVSTVRYQIKSTLAKTGTTRQTDLVRVLLSLPRQA
jgi:DNA-binding CsgD family transcriptional regulator